ncbi:hypothetical protein BGZ94_001565 [Podila epigama]|nr:hypothetical protein BGZ94_001565 [Podila epigama]
MTTIKSRFDMSSPDISSSSHHLDSSTRGSSRENGPWLSTYSRALCSMYPKEEDDCWDVLLSSQPSSVFTKMPSDDFTMTSSSTPHAQPNNSHPHAARHQRHRSARDREQLAAVATATTPVMATAVALTPDEEKLITTAVPMMSPGGSISHALCSVGFNCIDYLTSSKDDYFESSPSSLSAANEANIATDQEDLSADWAAAVCGKRTAALERKRVLSRSSNHSDNIDASNNDPWFAALDRLSRWDEVAYR